MMPVLARPYTPASPTRRPALPRTHVWTFAAAKVEPHSKERNLGSRHHKTHKDRGIRLPYFGLSPRACAQNELNEADSELPCAASAGISRATLACGRNRLFEILSKREGETKNCGSPICVPAATPAPRWRVRSPYARPCPFDNLTVLRMQCGQNGNQYRRGIGKVTSLVGALPRRSHAKTGFAVKCSATSKN